MRRSHTDYLNDMVHYAQKVREFTKGLEYEQFVRNEEKFLAVIHAIQIIGEAAHRLPKHFKAQHPGVPWDDIAGMRHFIVHSYYVVDPRIVWRTIQEDIPALQQMLAEILAATQEEENA